MITVADLIAKLRLKPDAASFEAGSKLIGGIKAGIAAITAFAGIRWAKGLIDQTVELGGKISDLSQKIGVPAETLQQLGYAADQSGSSMESLGHSLGKLSKLAFDAKKGGKEAAEAFRQVGVRFKGANGELRPAEELLADIADKIAAMPDGTEKTAKAMALFGRSGKDLIPLLNEGGEGIAKLRQEFIDLGGQIDGDTVDALEAFGDEQDKIKVAMDGLRNQAVAAILPSLRELVKTFLEWFKANRAILRQQLERFFKALVVVLKVLGKAFVVFTRVVDVALNMLANYAQMIVENWNLIATSVAGAIGAILAFKSAAIGAALATMAAWAVPIAILAGLALLIEDLWVWSKGGNSAIGTLHKAAVSVFVDAIEFWVKAAQDFFDFMDRKIGDLGKKFRDIPQSIRDGLVEAVTGKPVTYSSVNSAVQQAAFRRQQAAERASLGPLSVADEEFLKASPVYQQQHPELDPRLRQKNVNVTAPITINVQGGDPKEIERQVRFTWEGMMRQAAAAAAD